MVALSVSVRVVCDIWCCRCERRNDVVSNVFHYVVYGSLLAWLSEKGSVSQPDHWAIFSLVAPFFGFQQSSALGSGWLVCWTPFENHITWNCPRLPPKIAARLFFGLLEFFSSFSSWVRLRTNTCGFYFKGFAKLFELLCSNCSVLLQVGRISLWLVSCSQDVLSLRNWLQYSTLLWVDTSFCRPRMLVKLFSSFFIFGLLDFELLMRLLFLFVLLKSFACCISPFFFLRFVVVVWIFTAFDQ